MLCPGLLLESTICLLASALKSGRGKEVSGSASKSESRCSLIFCSLIFSAMLVSINYPIIRQFRVDATTGFADMLSHV